MKVQSRCEMPHRVKRNSSSLHAENNNKTRRKESTNCTKLIDNVEEIFKTSFAVFEQILNSDESRVSCSQSNTRLTSGEDMFAINNKTDLETPTFDKNDRMRDSDWLKDRNQLQNSDKVNKCDQLQTSDQSGQLQASEQSLVKNMMDPAHYNRDFTANYNTLDNSNKGQNQITSYQMSAAHYSRCVSDATYPMMSCEIYITLLVS